MAVGGGVIGALRVVLGADTAAFESGLKRGSSQLDKFGAAARKTGIALAGAMSLAVVGLGMAIRGTLNEADKLGKMAQSIGVPVEELSKLKHAADLSGVSLEELSKGVGRLARNLVEGAQGLSTPIRAFEALGISIRNTDGSLKTVSDALPEIAEKFSKMRDGPEKTALSMQLLGRAGASLIPMLNLGKAGLIEMMKEAEALGLVFSTKTVAGATEFNDNLRRLQGVIKGIIIQVTGALASALAMFSGALVTLAKNSDLAKVFADGLVTVIKGAVTAAYTAAIAFRRLGAELSAVWEALNGATRADRLKGWENLRIEGEKTKEQFAAIPKVLEKFWSDAEEAAKRFITTTSGGDGKPTITNAQETTAALQRQQEVMREGLAVFEATRTPIQLLSEEMARLNMLLQAGAIDWETYQIAAATASANSNIAFQQSGQALSSAMGGAVNEAIGFLNLFSGKSKAAAIAAIALSKGVAIAQTIQSTAAAAAAAFLPPPIGAGPLGGAALAGAIKAFGAVQVGLIAATGIAQGASVGRGGVSVPSSGSRAAVSDSAVAQSGSGGGLRSVNVTLHGEVFSRDAVESLFKQFAEAVGDGLNSPFVVKLA